MIRKCKDICWIKHWPKVFFVTSLWMAWLCYTGLSYAALSNTALSNIGPSCDSLTALEADPLAKAPPVEFENIDAEAAITACLEEMKTMTQDDPSKGRLLMQLGRGYLAAGMASKAKENFQASKNLDYPAGAFALGVFYLVGEDGEQDLTLAKANLDHALDHGVIWSARALMMLHQQPGAYFSMERWKHYQSIWQSR